MPYDDRYRLGRDPNTPINRLNQAYTAGTGPYTPRPVNTTPDLGPGAVRRGRGDIWAAIRDQMAGMRNQGSPGDPDAGRVVRDVGQVLAPVGRGLVRGYQQGIEAPRTGAYMGPEDRARAMSGQSYSVTPGTVSEHEKRRLAQYGGAPAAPPPRSIVNTAQADPRSAAPADPSEARFASTYQRPEGAPTGTTALPGQPPVASTQPAGQSGRSRYLDMYYASPEAQQGFVQGLPAGQAPIELIRGVPGSARGKADPKAPGHTTSYWSPTTGKEYATPLEAALGKSHAEEMGLGAEREKQAAEMAKTIAGKTAQPVETKLTTVMMPDGTERVYDSSTKRFYDPNAQGKENPDYAVVQQAAAKMIGMTPDQQDEEFRKLPSAQRKMLIDILRQMEGGK